MLSLELEALLRLTLLCAVYLIAVPNYEIIRKGFRLGSKIENHFQSLNTAVSRIVLGFSLGFSRIQTGLLNDNLILFSFGLLFLLLVASL
jgi:hypothetical protein